ncbi:hypothetical protein MY55_21405 [Chromobacterium subtsugae]|nr:hypothetical protein MY55_21405 [Chromobacterium subtsugae]
MDPNAFNSTISDIGSEITNSVPRDGQAAPTANLPMGNFRHTGVANGQARNDYAALAQVQDNTVQTLTSVGGTDTIVATVLPAFQSYAVGQVFRGVMVGSNATTSPTLNINSVGAVPIVLPGAKTVSVGDIPANGAVFFYNGTQFVLLNPVSTYSHVVPNLTAVRALVKTGAPNAFVTGHDAQGDGGGGNYYLDPLDTTSADNNGTIIVATDGGRWKLSPVGSNINVQTFGAKCDGVTNDTAAVQAADIYAAAVHKKLKIPGVCYLPTYVFTSELEDTMGQMFTPNSNVTISANSFVRPEWWGTQNNIVDLAIHALPASGGIVQLEDKTYPPNGYAVGMSGVGSGKYISKDNVKLVGRKMPSLTNDCKALTGGTIIQGMLLAWANQFEMSDLGIDCGYTVLQNVYGGVEAAGITEAYNFTYPDTTTAASPPAAPKMSSKLHNIIGLCSSPGAPTHAMLIGEGLQGLETSGVIMAVYGQHGVVIKCKNAFVERIEAYMNQSDSVIFKADAGATQIAGGVDVESIYCRAAGPINTAPYATSQCNAGVMLNAHANNLDDIKIGTIHCEGYPFSVYYTWDGPYAISSIDIDHIFSDQFGVTVAGRTAVSMNGTAGQSLQRNSIKSIDARNTIFAVAHNMQGGAGLVSEIGRLEATNVQNAVNVGYGSVLSINVLSVTSASDAVYFITGSPRLLVNMLFKDVATPAVYSSLSGSTPPTLSNSWANQGGVGNEQFGVDLLGGKISLKGLLTPGTSNVIATLPYWARPVSNKRYSAVGFVAPNNVYSVPITVGSNGVVTVNEVVGGTANCSTYVSLSGISYDIVS